MMPSKRQQVVEGLQGFGVGDPDVLGAGAILQPGMLGADARIVEAGGDRVGLDDLAVFVLQQVGAVAVQHAGRPAAGRMPHACQNRYRYQPPRRPPDARPACSMYGWKMPIALEPPPTQAIT